MTSHAVIRVLCADDHELIRDGIAFALEKEEGIELVASTSNGAEAVEAFHTYSPDIVLMDLRMPVLDGLEALQAIRKQSPRAKCIVLTTYEGDVQATRAIKAGAQGYLLKTMLRKQLVEAIRAVYGGKRYIPHEVALAVAESVAVEELSPRELDVLKSIAAGCGNKVIADRLKLSENTVKGHIKNIITKLDAEDRAHAVFIAMRRGLLDKG